MAGKTKMSTSTPAKMHSGDRESSKMFNFLKFVKNPVPEEAKSKKKASKIKQFSTSTAEEVVELVETHSAEPIDEQTEEIVDTVDFTDIVMSLNGEPNDESSTSNVGKVLPLPEKLPTYGNVLKEVLRLTKSSLTPEEEVEVDTEYLKYEMNFMNLRKIRSVPPKRQIVMFHKLFTEFVTCKKRAFKSRQKAANEVRRAEVKALKEKLNKSKNSSEPSNIGKKKKKSSSSKTMFIESDVHSDMQSVHSSPEHSFRAPKRKSTSFNSTLASKHMRVSDGDIGDDWLSSGQQGQWIQLASQQRMFMWNFTEFMPSSEREHIAAEFDDYITLFREYAEKSGVTEDQQMTRLQISSGKAIRNALAIIRTRRMEPFVDLDEMVNTLANHWKDGIDQLSIEEKFKNTKRGKSERFCEYFQRLQVAVNKLITVRNDSRRIIKTEQLLFAAMAKSADDESVQLKARSYHNESIPPDAVKTSRIEKFITYLKNKDEHAAAKSSAGDDTLAEDFVAKVERGNANVGRPPARFEDNRNYDRNFNFNNRNRPQDYGRRVQSKDQFERRSENYSRPMCKQCNSLHHPSDNCKCDSCHYRHSKETDCPVCYKCNVRGHKARHCRGPQRYTTEYEQKGRYKTESFKDNREVKKVEPVEEEDEKSKVNNDPFSV